jgi:transaldolase
MMKEGKKLAKIAKNVAVKVPLTRLGAHVATLPPNVLRGLFKNVLTDNGLKAFLDDWKKTGQSIL